VKEMVKKYKAIFYKRGENRYPWVIPPELKVCDEVRPGQRFQIKKHGKLWRVVDVSWCFSYGEGRSVFSHFNCGVV